MLYKQLMSLKEKTINTIVYHFNYNAICHKTAIRQICHIKSQIACITFISYKLKALFLDYYVAHAQLHIITFHWILQRNWQSQIIPVSSTMPNHPVRFRQNVCVYEDAGRRHRTFKILFKKSIVIHALGNQHFMLKLNLKCLNFWNIYYICIQNWIWFIWLFIYYPIVLAYNDFEIFVLVSNNSNLE